MRKRDQTHTQKQSGIDTVRHIFFNAATGRTQNALSLFRESIRLFPKSPQAYNNLGSILIDQKNYIEAEFYLTKAINLKKY